MHETIQIRRLREMAARRGWSWTSEPGSGFCGRLLTGARSLFVIGADIGVNSSSAARIARDKAFAQFFLSQAGLATIPTRVLYSREDAQAINDFPVLLKPNEGHGGAGVSVAESAEEIASAYQMARAFSSLVLGQPVIHQREFRIVVFNRRPLLAYEKKPLTVLGDGVRPLRNLIAQDGRRAFQTHGQTGEESQAAAKLLADPRLSSRLTRLGLSLNSILPCGREFVALPVANLTSGGTWRECLQELSPALLGAAVAAADALGLWMAGIDLFSESPGSGSCLINEVNASPGLECLAGEHVLLDPLFAAIEVYLSTE